MKFIHTADLHLASAMESRLPPDKARVRRKELFDTFRRLCDYAESEGVAAVMICGDIFDEGKPRDRYVRDFVAVVRDHPTVDFLCLAGNHDESLSSVEGLPDNLLCFSDRARKYSYGEVDIYGMELNGENYGLIYREIDPDPSRVNFVMLHGQAVAYGAAPAPGTILLPLLCDKGVDYLALGHIHSYREEALDRRGVWCYSGCLEGRGYDECGTKGFVLIDTDGGTLKRTFIPFAERMIVEKNVLLTGAESEYDVEQRVSEAVSGVSPSDLVRVNLTGEVGVSLHFHTEDLEKALENRFFAASVKNRTGPVVDVAAFAGEPSLRGEFVRTVTEDGALSEEEKTQILRCGILALTGEEVSFP
ncbi:MAG: metallophosphoesterase [Clostridia bacterium]|nr:metallophosphoesterase [Clostridia bacterium]